VTAARGSFEDLNTTVAAVGDEEPASRIHFHVTGKFELTQACSVFTDDLDQLTRLRRKELNSMVPRIGDEECLSSNSSTLGSVQLTRLWSQTAYFTYETKGRRGSFGCTDNLNPAVVAVDYVDSSPRITGNASRVVERQSLGTRVGQAIDGSEPRTVVGKLENLQGRLTVRSRAGTVDSSPSTTTQIEQ
jgi:hypothetical protein